MTVRPRPATRVSAAESADTTAALPQRPEQADRIEIARRAGRFQRKFLGAPIRVTRKAGR